jgi:hypothetical protein
LPLFLREEALRGRGIKLQQQGVVLTSSEAEQCCNLYLKGKVQLNLALTKETRYEPEKWRTLCSYASNRQTADPNQTVSITLKMAERLYEKKSNSELNIFLLFGKTKKH